MLSLKKRGRGNYCTSSRIEEDSDAEAARVFVTHGSNEVPSWMSGKLNE